MTANELEIKKLRYSIARAETSKLEIDLKIDERLLEISRMKDHLVLQDKVISETLQKIKDLSNG